MKSRYQVYKTFEKYKQAKDHRAMDDICINKNGEFKLQVQQEFLKEYVNVNKDWKSLLLYHEIGSGKTCSAITLAEEFLKMDKKNKVTIILPARLRTNFLDELISPCGFQKYISNEDYVLFKSATTPVRTKNKIQKEFMRKIDENYTIMSFEGFRAHMLKHKDDIIGYIDDFTKNNLILIDEVHNVFSTTYEPKAYNNILQTGAIKKSVKGMNAILMQLISIFAHATCKMAFLTATPIFNNINQLRQLVQIMTGKIELPSNATLHQLIEMLRGKVSYFPGISKNAYPSVEYIYHDVMLTRAQEDFLYAIEDDNSDDAMIDNEDFFLIKQRLIELSALNKDQIDMKNAKEYAPKIDALIKTLNTSIGKQVVYTNFIKRSVNIIEKLLQQHGWFNLFDVIKYMNDAKEWDAKYKYRVYAIWSGDTKDDQKHIIKSVMNNTNNLYGKYVRLVVGSPSIKEGISFLHIQDMHIMDPVWNMSAKNQVEGRVIRYCSHADIDEKEHDYLKRTVKIHYYKSIHRPKGIIKMTADERIYDDIIPKKYVLVSKGEKLLKKVALDYHLFKNMYNDKHSKTPTPPRSKSAIDYGDNDIGVRAKGNRQVKLCPKKRRPINGECPVGWEVRPNKDNVPCCYKIRGVKKPKVAKVAKATKTACPKDRRPVNGVCSEGYILRPNKSGVPCCYKTTRERRAKA